MKGIFKKLFNLGGDDTSQALIEKSTAKKPSLEPNEKSAEIEFVENFTRSGGKFLFCEDVDDAIANIQNIAMETGLQKIYSPDENLKSLIGKAGLRSFIDNCKEAELFCSTCEYLVAYNGGIMVSVKQTKGKKLGELPDVFIILAYTDQLVGRLNEALAGIRVRYKGEEIPSEITTLHGPRKSGLQDPGGITAAKDIYLLYVERSS